MKSLRLLLSFAWYCIQHPEERFWQALRNWSGNLFIWAGDMRPHARDTFHWTRRDGD